LHTVKSRRKWFNTFAQNKSIEPLVPTSWYKFDVASLLDVKVLYIY
jgi:hypothetical protein